MLKSICLLLIEESRVETVATVISKDWGYCSCYKIPFFVQQPAGRSWLLNDQSIESKTITSRQMGLLPIDVSYC